MIKMDPENHHEAKQKIMGPLMINMNISYHQKLIKKIGECVVDEYGDNW